MMKPLKII